MFISEDFSVKVHKEGDALSGISVSSYVSATYFI